MSFFGKLFGSKNNNTTTKGESSHNSSTSRSAHSSQSGHSKSKTNSTSSDKATGAGSSRKTGPKSNSQTAAAATKKGHNASGRKPTTGKRRSRKTGKKSNILIDISKPLSFPATPELILAHHKNKPFLDQNEEWLVVELNEYECLVDNLEIIRIVAKHSKFFEIEPDELWMEFFEFVDGVPSYDEVINYDVWQEFRDVKYPC